ncbi:MAG TPA: bifunctional hydroxymethylpyrimidine kinase/phosphomethylpyrimidine kinase, partial [Duganella sp.]
SSPNPGAQARALQARGCRHVLITGGHDDGAEVVNRWFGPGADALNPGTSNANAPNANAPDAGPRNAAAPNADTLNAGMPNSAAPNADTLNAGMPDSAAPGAAAPREWRWPRLNGGFHGSGCTLASAIAGQLALGVPPARALALAQQYCNVALRDAYTIAPGQRIPLR